MAIPIIHQTDLFHPHGDPDDHYDLATIFGLATTGRCDPRGIVIDFPPPRRLGDPALASVAQLGLLTGHSVAVAIGSARGMSNRHDVDADASVDRRQAVLLIHRVLREASEPVVIHVVGSCTDVVRAALQEPDLFRQRCRAVYLNAGSGSPEQGADDRLEFNVALNPAAYAAAFDLPCPLYWCPCWQVTERHESSEWGTYWRFRQGDVLEALTPRMQQYFLYMLDQEPSHRFLRYLHRPVDGARLAWFAAQHRNMWSTAGLLHGAGCTVNTDGALVSVADGPRDAVFEFVPIEVTCDHGGRTRWRRASAGTTPPRFIFRNCNVPAYAGAMTVALRDLLKAIG